MLHSHHLARVLLLRRPLSSRVSSPQPDVFPEMEVLWLLTHAWNTGILLYSLAQYPEAERWCGLAMSFIRHLGSLLESYERQVQQGTPRLTFVHNNENSIFWVFMNVTVFFFSLSLSVFLQMSVLYGEVLNRLDKTKQNLMEE